MSDKVTVPASLVPYLRSGVIAEFGSALDLLAVQLEADRIDAKVFDDALRSFDSARALLDDIGTSTQEAPRDIDLDLSGAPLLVLDALISVYRAEVGRLQDAEADGIHLPVRALPALKHLISALDNMLGESGKDQRDPTIGLAEKRTPRVVKAVEREQ